MAESQGCDDGDDDDDDGHGDDGNGNNVIIEWPESTDFTRRTPTWENSYPAPDSSNFIQFPALFGRCFNSAKEPRLAGVL